MPTTGDGVPSPLSGVFTASRSPRPPVVVASSTMFGGCLLLALSVRTA